MKCNVGGTDRAIRWVLAAVLLGVAAFADVSDAWRIAAAVLGLIALVTAWARFCPANLALGIDTCHARSGIRR